MIYSSISEAIYLQFLIQTVLMSFRKWTQIFPFLKRWGKMPGNKPAIGPKGTLSSAISKRTSTASAAGRSSWIFDSNEHFPAQKI